MFTPGFLTWQAAIPLLFSNDHSGLFNGVDEYVNLGTGLNQTGSSPFSLSVWLYPTNAGNFISNLDSSSNFNGFELEFGTSTTLYFYLVNNVATSAALIQTVPGSVTQNAWNHIVATYDGSRNTSGMAIYVNGTAVTTVSLQNNLVGSISSAQPVELGQRPNNTNQQAGNMTQVSFWNIALSSAQVTALYNSGTPTTLTGLSGLVSWYQFSEDLTPPDTDTGTIYDRKGSNNGTTVNTSAGFLSPSVP